MNNQLQTNSKAPWYQDRTKLVGAIVGAPLVAYIAYLVLTFVIPWAATVVWNMVNLVIGGVTLFILTTVLTSKKFWKRMGYLYTALLKLSLGWIIEFDAFVILEMQLESKVKDREKLLEQSQKLKGKRSELSSKISEQQDRLRIETEKATIARNNSNLSAAQLAINSVNRATNYIDKITPIFKDIEKLIIFCDKAYQLSGDAILNAKEDLKMQKDLYYSVTTGSSAISSAMKAFTGDTDLNSDAEFALEKLRESIGQQIGQIQSAINITTQFMDAAELENAAQSASTLKMIDKFNVNEAFTYIPVENTDKQFLGSVTVSKDNQYQELLLK